MSFLPQGYQAPKGASYYTKIAEGENRVRILSKPIFGWEDWHDKKPVRYRMDNKPVKSYDPKKPVRHFWAFIVFNHQEEQIQIMQITQATIRKSIESLCNDKDWGSPYGYDIKIMKTGEGTDTEYAVNPVPHKPIDPYIVTCFNERPINLEALFDGEDPFTVDGGKFTKMASVEDDGPSVHEAKLVPSKKIVDIKDKTARKQEITDVEAEQIGELLSECSEDFVATVHDFMVKQEISTYRDFPREAYDRLKKKALIEKAKVYNKNINTEAQNDLSAD